MTLEGLLMMLMDLHGDGKINNRQLLEATYYPELPLYYRDDIMGGGITWYEAHAVFTSEAGNNIDLPANTPHDITDEQLRMYLTFAE